MIHFTGKGGRKQWTIRITHTASICFIFTEWDEIKGIAPSVYKELMQTPLVYDGRNVYSVKEMEEQEVEYHSIGR